MHKMQGATGNDLILQEMINKEVDVLYSPKLLKEHPEAEAEASSTTTTTCNMHLLVIFYY
jgi:hypothetical protein